MTLFRLSCFLTAIAIGLNALGHHALTTILTPNKLAIFETASHYLLLGGLWLMILKRPTTTLPKRPIQLLLLGLVLFCGSLFLYLLLPVKGLMLITPLGGILLMMAFVVLGIKTK